MTSPLEPCCLWGQGLQERQALQKVIRTAAAESLKVLHDKSEDWWGGERQVRMKRKKSTPSMVQNLMQHWDSIHQLCLPHSEILFLVQSASLRLHLDIFNLQLSSTPPPQKKQPWAIYTLFSSPPMHLSPSYLSLPGQSCIISLPEVQCNGTANYNFSIRNERQLEIRAGYMILASGSGLGNSDGRRNKPGKEYQL